MLNEYATKKLAKEFPVKDGISKFSTVNMLQKRIKTPIWLTEGWFGPIPQSVIDEAVNQ